MAILPPGGTPADFGSALAEFAGPVGKDWVLSSDQDLAPYRDHYSLAPLEDDELLVSPAVAPNTSDPAKTQR